MKKIFLMCCLVVGIAAASHAQGGRTRMSPEDQAKNMQTQLKLTDDQTAKLLTIFQAQSKTRDSIMTASNGDRQTAFQAMRPMMEQTNTKIKAILTDDQKAAYQKMLDERRARMQNGGGSGAPSNK